MRMVTTAAQRARRTSTAGTGGCQNSARKDARTATKEGCENSGTGGMPARRHRMPAAHGVHMEVVLYEGCCTAEYQHSFVQKDGTAQLTVRMSGPWNTYAASEPASGAPASGAPAPGAPVSDLPPTVPLLTPPGLLSGGEGFEILEEEDRSAVLKKSDRDPSKRDLEHEELMLRIQKASLDSFKNKRTFKIKPRWVPCLVSLVVWVALVTYTALAIYVIKAAEGTLPHDDTPMPADRPALGALYLTYLKRTNGNIYLNRLSTIIMILAMCSAQAWAQWTAFSPNENESGFYQAFVLVILGVCLQVYALVLCYWRRLKVWRWGLPPGSAILCLLITGASCVGLTQSRRTGTETFEREVALMLIAGIPTLVSNLCIFFCSKWELTPASIEPATRERAELEFLERASALARKEILDAVKSYDQSLRICSSRWMVFATSFPAVCMLIVVVVCAMWSGTDWADIFDARSWRAHRQTECLAAAACSWVFAMLSCAFAWFGLTVYISGLVRCITRRCSWRMREVSRKLRTTSLFTPAEIDDDMLERLSSMVASKIGLSQAPNQATPAPGGACAQRTGPPRVSICVGKIKGPE